jgi:dTDP-4-dehydrorhamnose 3,5-epimerase
MYDFQSTGFAGVELVRPTPRPDSRGTFVKLFHAPSFQEAGLATGFDEVYVSTSHAGVVRGMHFQAPPHDHAKLVYCLSGKVLDVVLDLRRDSATFGLAYSVELDGADTAGIYIPTGFAHGFASLQDGSALQYFVETPYAPSHDRGIRWDSFGFKWPIAQLHCSERDAALPEWAGFTSPF